MPATKKKRPSAAKKKVAKRTVFPTGTRLELRRLGDGNWSGTVVRPDSSGYTATAAALDVLVRKLLKAVWEKSATGI